MKYSVLIMVCLVSACGSTSMPADVYDLNDNYTRLDQRCVEMVMQRSQSVAQEMASHLAIAENAQACLADIVFSSAHPDNAQAMQLQALVVNSYLNAGDTEASKNALQNFRQKFPMQDLVYEDFTSFIDTATALLEFDQLSSHQLARLNINPRLRNELKRQKTWNL